MSLFPRTRERKLRRTAEAWPEGAHGRRVVDGSYFAVWRHSCGRCMVGTVEAPPNHCLPCAFDGSPDEGWARNTRAEAHAYVYELEAAKATDRTGFTLR